MTVRPSMNRPGRRSWRSSPGTGLHRMPMGRTKRGSPLCDPPGHRHGRPDAHGCGGPLRGLTPIPCDPHPITLGPSTGRRPRPMGSPRNQASGDPGRPDPAVRVPGIWMRVGVATDIPAPDADCPAGGAADVSAEEESLTDASLTDGLRTRAIRSPAPVTDGPHAPGIHHWRRSGPPGTPSDGPAAGFPRDASG